MAANIFIAGTGQHSGKTLVSLGLVAALTRRGYRVHYMKPVGQRAVKVGSEIVDEDVALINDVFDLPTPPKAGNPITIPSGYTRQFLLGAADSEPLMDDIRDSFAMIAKDADIVIVEGTGHAGVGSVLVAKIMPGDETKLEMAEQLVDTHVDIAAIEQAIFAD